MVPTKLAQAVSALRADPRISIDRLARLIGAPAVTRRDRLNVSMLLVRAKAASNAGSGMVPAKPAVLTDFKGAAGTVESPQSASIRTLDELLAAAAVDLTVWEVERWVANKWEVATGDGEGGAMVTPLFQVKAWLRRHQGMEDAEAIRRVFADAAGAAPNRKVRAAEPPPTDVLVEVSLPDLHLGKRASREETGADWSPETAERAFLDAMSTLLVRSRHFGPSRILLPIGNDLLNTDDGRETANGTPQDEALPWHESFRRGCALVRQAVEMAARIAPVDVLIVPGNHDAQRAWYLGEFLRGVFDGSPGVTVHNAPTPRQYFRWGRVLLGFAHGDRIKRDTLPMLMAGERPQDWAETTHREWHLGHLHHSAGRSYLAGDEVGPVRVRTLPSLCAPDSYHAKHGYTLARRAAEAYLWGARDGYLGHLSFETA